ncbi:hypothetical protein F4825DRAFT_457243 [Nemania diffusa]|nr:hypothetical protein F4825DRAFT_457243 [Nemania diffusa]
MQRPFFAPFNGQTHSSLHDPSALAGRLARSLGIKPEDVDVGKPLHAFGVDSLVAVELRN